MLLMQQHATLVQVPPRYWRRRCLQWVGAAAAALRPARLATGLAVAWVLALAAGSHLFTANIERQDPARFKMLLVMMRE